MENTLQSLSSTIRERIKSPFTGAYIISFICWHWQKIAVLLVSNSSIEERLICVTEDFKFVDTFIIPLLISLVGIFFFQLVNFGVEYLVSKIKVSRKKVQLDIIREELLLKEDHAKIEGRINESKTKHVDLDRLTGEIKILREENDSLKVDLTDLRKEKEIFLIERDKNDIKTQNSLKTQNEKVVVLEKKIAEFRNFEDYLRRYFRFKEEDSKNIKTLKLLRAYLVDEDRTFYNEEIDELERYGFVSFEDGVKRTTPKGNHFATFYNLEYPYVLKK
ncbi:hypothetical protein [Tenacibaculum sp.]|uniref:hypothetical protein n=1 Tax=Tenacibaculum sp. TaxID=1906242 RepID=UPI003AA8004E